MFGGSGIPCSWPFALKKNAEIELFGLVVFVVDWFATYRYLLLLSTRAYTGFAAGDKFCVAPPVTVFSEQLVPPTVNGRICPGLFVLAGPASVI